MIYPVSRHDYYGVSQTIGSRKRISIVFNVVVTKQNVKKSTLYSLTSHCGVPCAALSIQHEALQGSGVMRGCRPELCNVPIYVANLSV
jgi:hypothetical protein